jgi:hypothetical protein
MCRSRRSKHLTDRIARALILAVVVLAAGGIGAQSAEPPTAETSDEARASGSPGRSSFEMTATSTETETENEAEVSTRSVVPATPRPRAEAHFPERPLRLPTVRAVQPAGAGQHQPLTLASGDFDGDGVLDLICGYATADAGLLEFYAGNVDAIYPHSPGARLRRQQGTFSAEAFPTPPRTIELPLRPAFLAAGDFDGDDLWDVVLADATQPALFLLAGDGTGGFSPARRVPLPSAVTALAAGEINRADGLMDLAVGVGGGDSAALLVFEGPTGALRADAEVLPLRETPTRLVLGRFYGGPWHDVAVAAGRELVLVEGRDRRLVLGERARASVGPPALERIETPSGIEALAWGDFAWEPYASREFALLLEDGTLRLFAWDERAGWKTVGSREISTAPVSALVPVRLSGRSTTDLAILTANAGPLQLLEGMVRGTNLLADAGTLEELETGAPPVAVLPMRLNADALSDLVLLLPGTNAPVVATTAPLATLTVDSAADSTTAGDGLCTLREAIVNANTDSDTTSGDCTAGSGVDTITFSIAGGGSVATIAPLSALPEITDPVTIDGTTQGCASPPCVVLDGVGAGFVRAGVEVAAGSSTVRGLVIQRFVGDGADPDVNAYAIFLTSSGNIVEGNYCGTDDTGTIAFGNDGAGVRIEAGSNNTIGGTTSAAANVLSASVNGGGCVIRNMSGSAEENRILGNLVGADASGTSPLGNGGSGMSIDGSNNTVGGTVPGARNIVSGNAGNGVHFTGTPQGNLVQGNHVGTDITGLVAMPNGTNFPGVWIGAPDTTVGGTIPSARNIISGNASVGAFLSAATTQNSLILGNYIGTDATGAAALSNSSAGVITDNECSLNTIGGTVPGARNVISGNVGNGIGLREGTSHTTIIGNYIGTDLTGTAALGNLRGIQVNETPNNTIGGSSDGAGNLISGNNSDGVRLSGVGATANEIQGNLIGTDVTGSVDLGNTVVGVRIIDGLDNTVGGTSPGARNVISGNGSDGVFIGGTTSQNNSVLGNYIGTDATGTVALGNTLVGIEVDGGSLKTTIGGTDPGAGNLISGNLEGGIFVQLGTDSSVLGNFIGTDASGTAALGNGIYPGVEIWDADNAVGDVMPGAGNLISGNESTGVTLRTVTAQRNTIRGNLIGTDVTGTLGLPNGLGGIDVLDGPSENTIGGETAAARNVISGHPFHGIFMRDTTLNSVLGNYIGTDISGTSALGNALNGIRLFDCTDNTVGGTTAGARNVISGNGQDGVLLLGPGADDNVVLGNFIGTDASGASSLGNGTAGIRLSNASGNTIGGDVPGARNVISGNDTDGVAIAGAAAQDNVVQGNFIGTDASGTLAVGNLLAGIEIEGSSNNTVGGTSPGARNVISGNGDVQGWGVVLEDSSSNEVLGNFIGVQVDGVSPLGNRLAGVGLAAGSGNNTIGGTGVTPGQCDGPCNRIGFTTQPLNDGVRVLAGGGAGNAILGNAIHGCAELGIDLEGSGVTPNDPMDPDAGANNQQNFPVLSLAEGTPAGLTVSGTLNSKPGQQYRLEFFGSPACDGSGYREGARYLGTQNVTTDGSGDANFIVPAVAGVPHGDAITATASSTAFSLILDTSEFSQCVEAICLSQATLGQTVLAQDASTLAWTSPADVQFAKGPLAGVGGYVVIGAGNLPGATTLDISADLAPLGEGFYYVVRPIACGSWQTALGDEPLRDVGLP